jgi:hypothetical protein
MLSGINNFKISVIMPYIELTVESTAMFYRFNNLCNIAFNHFNSSDVVK